MAVVGSRSRHLSIAIDRPVAEVYAFAADPANLPRWAAGLAGSRLERDGDQWFTQSPMGRVAIRFTPRNEFGVLDHDVTLPSGETVYNPVRVIADGAGSEVVFTLRQRPGMTDRDVERDAEAVAADLAALKSLVEAG
jgi:Polyketide cyclase / dehydrase and lipid transport